MLTGDLLRVRVTRSGFRPRWVDPGDERLIERAEALLSVFRHGLEAGWTRGRIEAACREIEGLEPDYRLTRGLAKLLAQRCTFETRAFLDPRELRRRVFTHAAATGPLARHAGPTGRRTAEDVLREVASELGTDPGLLRRALYADLKEEQVLVKARLPENAPALLHRYNVALVQAIMLRAEAMTVTLARPAPKHLRQFYRYLKFFQLMYRVRPTPGQSAGGVEFTIDGPESLLRQSTRYGMQLANFLPVVLQQPGPWKMLALVRWGRRRLRKKLVVTDQQGLVSHYPEQGTWRSRTEQWFEERFLNLHSEWQLLRGIPIDLGSQNLLLPDFTFRNGDRVAHLDIVGYWRKGYLQKRLQQTPPNVILAVSRKLRGEAGALPKSLSRQIIEFAEVIPAQEVLARVEAVATR